MQSTPFRKLILGSASPRRKALLEAMGLSLEVRPALMEETYPIDLVGHQITDYLSEQKAKLLQPGLEAGSLLITADTIVWHENEVLEKPAQIHEARRTLSRLSGKWHKVITSVCFTGMGIQRTVHSITEVKFAALSHEMIETYLSDGQPLDKAGAYGIQEWIGLVGVEDIKGSYTNVVGLPTQLVYTTLQELMG